MKRQLSSIITPFYKFVPYIVGSFGLFLLIFRNIRFSVFLFFLLWSGVWYAFTYNWKSVYLKGDVLSVSNYLKRIEIPLSAVESVKASSWWGRQPRIITLRLKSASAFGEEIVFVPRFGGLEAGEVADELRNLLASHKSVKP